MDYLVHNASRSRFNRTLRATQPVHGGHKQYIMHDKRLLRGRPVRVTDEELDKYLEELKEKHAQGLIHVTTLDGRPVDIYTRGIGKVPPPSPPLNKRLDSAANDKPRGIEMPRFPGEISPPKDFTMPVEPPAAALSHPIDVLEESNVNKDAKEDVLAEAVDTRPMMAGGLGGDGHQVVVTSSTERPSKKKGAR